MGGKGGVGKSVFAANFAFTLMFEMRAKTLLIDLDAKSCGDQNVITGIRPQKTAIDIANFASTINANTLNTLVSPHPTGLHFIGAVQTPDQTLDVPPDLFRKQLFAISQHYKFIVVDIGCDMTPLQMGMIEDSSAVIIVTTPEVLAVNQTRKAMNDLMAATVPADLFQIVLNKVSRTGLDPRAISQGLRRPIVGSIPQDETTAYGALQRSTPFVLTAQNTPLAAAYHEISRKLTGGILQKLKALTRPQNLQAAMAPAPGAAAQLQSGPSSMVQRGAKGPKQLDPLTLLKMQIHTELIKEMDLKKDLTGTKGDPAKEKELRTKTTRVITQLVDKLGHGLPRDQRSRIIKEVLDEALGLGPLEDLLADPGVTEIMVNGCDKIYVEKGGKLTLSTVTFTSNLQLRNVIERIVTPLGRRIDEKTPYCDARLADGSRVNAVIEPLAIDGPALTIRKFPSDRITSDDYVNRFNSLTQPMVDFLKICVEQGLNIIISGGTGSGKTTLLNVLSTFIPTNERIITVEDAAELQLKQEHVVRLETRPANMEGTGEITIRDLVRNSLRMRPDRIVVGECRDGAALDMLAAMNTGHDGSMTTVHANNPREGISRLETLCLMAGMDLPVRAIREQIAGAVNMIVQISRLSDGSRRVTSITEVVGMQGETVTLQEIFRFKEEGFDKNRKIVGTFQAMGLIPTFIEKFEARGVTIPRNLFTTSAADSASRQTPKPAGLARPRIGAPSGTPRITRPNPVKKTGSGGDNT
ncbi:MAG: Flp pilus assembly complex ATPase component TadA [Bdellovibrionaceae bacterium]|nr:Flp pilus assembly complex ATPase component TadA [Bdellovibrionales bacterium]MCB9085361.1 Flp pilus assembly complex ATPase component TadA [Pseudobdellovibrionaceae bacterium]